MPESLSFLSIQEICPFNSLSQARSKKGTTVYCVFYAYILMKNSKLGDIENALI